MQITSISSSSSNNLIVHEPYQFITVKSPLGFTPFGTDTDRTGGIVGQGQDKGDVEGAYLNNIHIYH